MKYSRQVYTYGIYAAVAEFRLKGLSLDNPYPTEDDPIDIKVMNKLIKKHFPKGFTFSSFEPYAINLGLADMGVNVLVPNDGIRESANIVERVLREKLCKI